MLYNEKDLVQLQEKPQKRMFNNVRLFEATLELI